MRSWMWYLVYFGLISYFGILAFVGWHKIMRRLRHGYWCCWHNRCRAIDYGSLTVGRREWWSRMMASFNVNHLKNDSILDILSHNCWLSALLQRKFSTNYQRSRWIVVSSTVLLVSNWSWFNSKHCVVWISRIRFPVTFHWRRIVSRVHWINP